MEGELTSESVVWLCEFQEEKMPFFFSLLPSLDIGCGSASLHGGTVAAESTGRS